MTPNDVAFGNETDWIIGGVQRALNLYNHVDLDVAIVSYGSSRQCVRQLLGEPQSDRNLAHGDLAAGPSGHRPKP